jgi:hypothetical protein
MSTASGLLRTAAQLDAVVEADDAARRFQERFDSVTKDLRDSLHREKVLLDECRQLCESSMSQTQGLEMAMSNSLADATEIEALRARLIDAERSADEARLKETNARLATSQKHDELSQLRTQLQESAQQASRLRNVITAQAQKEKPTVVLKKLGSGLTPFDDWKAATGRVTLHSAPEPRHGLSASQLRRLGHVPADELDRLRGAVASAVAGSAGCGAGDGAPGSKRASSEVSRSDAAGALAFTAERAVPFAADSADDGEGARGGHGRAWASPLRAAALGVFGGAGDGGAARGGASGDAHDSTGRTDRHHSAHDREGHWRRGGSDADSRQPQAPPAQQQRAQRFLEVEPHALFPAHLYLAPVQRPEERAPPLSVSLLTRSVGSFSAAAAAASAHSHPSHPQQQQQQRTRQQARERVALSSVGVADGDRDDSDPYDPDHDEEDVRAGWADGATGGGASGVGAPVGHFSPGSLHAQYSVTPESSVALGDVEGGRDHVTRLFARIEARAAKLTALRGDPLNEGLTAPGGAAGRVGGGAGKGGNAGL